MSDLAVRVTAINKVAQEWLNTDFVWGQYDCTRLAAASLRALGNKVKLSKFGHYTTHLGAIRAVKKAGYSNLVEAIDDHPGLLRIPPASVVIGDLFGIHDPRADEGWPILSVVIGAQRVLCFFDNEDGQNKCVVFRPTYPEQAIAWRVPCNLEV